MDTYDPNKFVIAIGNIIVTATVKGTRLKIAPREDAMKMVSGVGAVILVKLSDFTAMATLTLMPNSRTNDLLSVWLLANSRKDTVPTTKPFGVKDLLGNTVGVAPNCVPIKTPDLDSAGDDASPREWTFILDDWRPLIGSSI